MGTLIRRFILDWPLQESSFMFVEKDTILDFPLSLYGYISKIVAKSETVERLNTPKIFAINSLHSKSYIFLWWRNLYVNTECTKSHSKFF